MAEPSSRERLVGAAVELVLEHHRGGADLRAAFGYLTPGAVARRAGVSRALIYHHWGDGDDAVRSLLGVVAGRIWQLGTDLGGIAEAVEAWEALPAGSLTLADVVQALSWFEMERCAGELRPVVRAAQTLLLHGVVDASDVESLVAEMAGLYARLGVVLGLEPVPPLTWEDLALAVSATTEGFSYGVNVRRDELLVAHDWVAATEPSSPGVGWNLLGIVVEASLRRMLRPVDGGGPAPAIRG